MIRIILGIAAGAMVGFAYSRFIVCTGGACKISANPYLSSAYWALLGGFIATAL